MLLGAHLTDPCHRGFRRSPEAAPTAARRVGDCRSIAKDPQPHGVWSEPENSAFTQLSSLPTFLTTKKNKKCLRSKHPETGLWDPTHTMRARRTLEKYLTARIYPRIPWPSLRPPNWTVWWLFCVIKGSVSLIYSLSREFPDGSTGVLPRSWLVARLLDRTSSLRPIASSAYL